MSKPELEMYEKDGATVITAKGEDPDNEILEIEREVGKLLSGKTTAQHLAVCATVLYWATDGDPEKLRSFSSLIERSVSGVIELKQ